MKTIKIILMGIFAISLVTGCGCEKKEEESQAKEEAKVNTNEGVVKDQVVESFKMENTSLVYENNTTLLETTVTNTSDKTEYLKEFEIKVMDKDGNEITTLIGFVGESIEAGETKVINSYSGQDLSHAYSISYTVKR